MNFVSHSTLYPAATLVAAKLESYFAGCAESPSPNEQEPARILDRETIEQMINTAFWASLQREEGYSSKLSLAFLPAQQPWLTMRFAEPLPLVPNALIKLSPGVKFSGGHLGVWRSEQNRLAIWGGTQLLPQNCFVLEILEPGLLVVKQNRGNRAGKLANILILSADQIKEINRDSTDFSGDFFDCPAMLSEMLDFAASSSANNQICVPLELAAQMRKHGHGSSLLVVPQNSEKWRESTVSPTTYSLSPSFTRLADLVRRRAKPIAQPER